MISGRLQLFYKEWVLITTNSVILNWIQGYRIPLDMPPRSSFPIKESIFDDKDKHFIKESIKDLLSIGAIDHCKPT